MATDSQSNAAATARDTDRAARFNPSRLSVFGAVFVCSAVVITASVLGSSYGTQRYWQSALRDEITQSLAQKARMLANRVTIDHSTSIQDIAAQEGQAAGARATIIDTNGKVIADSEIGLRNLQDESLRPEFTAALHGRTGIEIRAQNDARVLYVAVPVSGGAVRLAYPLADVDIVATGAHRTFWIIEASAVLVAFLIAALATKLISRIWVA